MRHRKSTDGFISHLTYPETDYAKNDCNRRLLLVILENVVVFLGTQCAYITHTHNPHT